ncbi:MAG: hypothetical protein LBC55_08865 [Desulfovibrio sp.]|jgi:hypothetical protein|nr:hypothetical protein [Desulfovibrio sp.]
MENYPKVDGESAWLTQAVYAEPAWRQYDLSPVKLVFVGVPASLTALCASFILGKRITCALDEDGNIYQAWSFQKENNNNRHYRVTRMPICGTAYAVSVLTCTELVDDTAPSSAVEQLLLRKVKEMRLPCLPEWAGYIRANLGDTYIRPLSTFNVSEDMFIVQLPTAESFLKDFLMKHLGSLKGIAERGLAA